MDRSDRKLCGRHRARAPFHRVRGVVPADRAWPQASNAACHQPAGESLVRPGFRRAGHVPTAGDRRVVLSAVGPPMAELQPEGGENSVRRIEVGCHCWLSS
jgi:hypothetical protein